MKVRGVGFQLANFNSIRSASKMFALLLAASFAVSAVGGCGPNVSPPEARGRVDIFEPSLPVVSGADLETRVQHSERPLLVEFGVNFGCYRCDQMRPGMTNLAREFEGRADVVRVDFNFNRQLAARFGTTICPSYVLFDRGQVVAKRSFPTSADLLALDLASILASADEGATK